MTKPVASEAQAETPLDCDDRCGNCDHHSELHGDNGCTVRIQQEDGKRFRWMVDCPCKWNTNQATTERSRPAASGEARDAAERAARLADIVVDTVFNELDRDCEWIHSRLHVFKLVAALIRGEMEGGR